MSTKRKIHRFETINYMFDIGFEKYEITVSERLIFCALWNLADVKGYCTVSLNRIQSMTGLAKSTIQLGLNKFVNELEIIRIAKDSTRKGIARTYQLKHFYYTRGRKKET